MLPVAGRCTGMIYFFAAGFFAGAFLTASFFAAGFLAGAFFTEVLVMGVVFFSPIFDDFIAADDLVTARSDGVGNGS